MFYLLQWKAFKINGKCFLFHLNNFQSNNFLMKNYVENMAERLVPDRFLFFKKLHAKFQHILIARNLAYNQNQYAFWFFSNWFSEWFFKEKVSMLSSIIIGYWVNTTKILGNDYCYCFPGCDTINYSYLSNQAIFLHNQGVKTKMSISWEQNWLLKVNFHLTKWQDCQKRVYYF